ncbi:MAG: hypothetical protein H0W09_03315 [Solirubrobacterales bacterium]|nr:hypothetical protein [Solirubrobacterales bacterium]
MIAQQHFEALLGFLFVAAWIGFGFGDAVLCLLGALAFYAIGSFLRGELDLAEVQERLGGSGSERSSAGTRGSGVS